MTDGSGAYLLDKLNGLSQELGFSMYTGGSKDTVDVFFITVALMVGTAGLPHVIVPSLQCPKCRMRVSRPAGHYCSLPFCTPLHRLLPHLPVLTCWKPSQCQIPELPSWFQNWEKSGLLAWQDKNGDGVIQYLPGKAVRW